MNHPSATIADTLTSAAIFAIQLLPLVLATGLIYLAVAPAFPLWRVAAGCAGSAVLIFASIRAAR
jgi:hypothetical protein